MQGSRWLVGASMVVSLLGACMPTPEASEEAAPAEAPGPVRLSDAEIADAIAAAACVGFEEEAGSLSARHVGEDAPAAPELYPERPPTAGDHLGAWIAAGVYPETPDERAVVHNHEHGAVSVWYDPDRLAAEDLDDLVAWAEGRNGDLANEAGAGVLVAPFVDGLPDDATVSFRAWSGGLDCRSFDRTVADGFLLDHFGHAPEGNLAPELGGVVDRATAA